MASDAVVHGLPAGDLEGTEAFRAFHAAFNGVFSEISVTVERTIEDSESVAAWCKARMTHRETGKVTEFNGAVIGTFRDGMIQESWDCWNFLGLLTQLGTVDAAVVEATFSP